MSIDRAETNEQQAIRAARLDGLFQALITQPTTRTGFELDVQHALGAGQELRGEIDFRRLDSLNQGVSEFDLPERAYSRAQSDGEIRLSHRATIRKKFVNNLRVQYQWQNVESQSVSDAQTIRVLDAFTEGGAQISGSRREGDLQIENELQFTLKRAHQMEFGASIRATVTPSTRCETRTARSRLPASRCSATGSRPHTRSGRSIRTVVTHSIGSAGICRTATV